MNEECKGCRATNICLTAVQPGSVMCQIYRIRLGQTKDEQEKKRQNEQRNVYGYNDGILGTDIDALARCPRVEIADPTKTCLLTDSAADKWRKRENADKQGRLLELPCAVGDTVWDNDWGTPCDYDITGFSFGNLNEDYFEDDITVFDQIIAYYRNSSGGITGSFAVSEIGKTVFLTREEAEKALKEKTE